MGKLSRNVVALGAAALMGLSPAYAKTSLGIYQTTDRKMDYELTLCGDGTQLCVKLTAARGSALTAQTSVFIGHYIVKEATASGKNTWNGQVTMQGHTATGSLTLSPGKRFTIHGCVYFVMCSDFMLIPAK